MLHRRLTGIAFISAAAVAGCFTQGQSGDPGAGFLGGSGRYYAGTAGWSGSGSAGASSTSDAGAAGATGEGGSICGVGVIMATPDGGTRADGATTDASARDGATANEAGAASDASRDGVAATEAGATEAGAAAPAAVCTVGAISLSWSLEEAGTTIAETCAQAGVATIRLVANAMNLDFSCGNGAGRTPALAAGTYAVSLHALDAKGLSISDTPTMNVTVVAGQITALGEAVFDVD